MNCPPNLRSIIRVQISPGLMEPVIPAPPNPADSPRLVLPDILATLLAPTTATDTLGEFNRAGSLPFIGFVCQPPSSSVTCLRPSGPCFGGRPTVIPRWMSPSRPPRAPSSTGTRTDGCPSSGDGHSPTESQPHLHGQSKALSYTLQVMREVVWVLTQGKEAGLVRKVSWRPATDSW